MTTLTRDQLLGQDVPHPVFGPARPIIAQRAIRELKAARAAHARYEVPFGFELPGYDQSAARVRTASEVADMYWEYGES